jgi:hypothetical protein
MGWFSALEFMVPGASGYAMSCLTLMIMPAEDVGFRVLAVLKSNRLIRKHTDANCSSFHLRVFLGLSNPQGQRQTSILSIPRDNLRK